MLKKQSILDIPFVSAGWSQVEKHLSEVLASNKTEIWITANPEIVERSFQDKELSEILKEKAVVFPDGVGILWASKKLRSPLPGRLPGIEMFPIFKGHSVYLLGAKASVIKKAAEILTEQGLNVIGHHQGYFDELEEEVIKQEINKLKPQILIVGLGMGRQEKWLARNLNKLNVKIGVTVGGSFDVISGQKKRAPKLVQKMNLEWLYRLGKEPGRIFRQIVLVKFAFRVLWQYKWGRRNIK